MILKTPIWLVHLAANQSSVMSIPSSIFINRKKIKTLKINYIAFYKQSHTSRKNDVFIVLESETTLPLIIVEIIQNRTKITPIKNLDQFPFLLFTDIPLSTTLKSAMLYS